MTPVAYALAVYHEARRMTRRRALGPSWSGNPCPSGGNPYGACESCRGYMGRAVAWLLHPEPQVGYTLSANYVAEAAARRRKAVAPGAVPVIGKIGGGVAGFTAVGAWRKFRGGKR